MLYFACILYWTLLNCDSLSSVPACCNVRNKSNHKSHCYAPIRESLSEATQEYHDIKLYLSYIICFSVSKNRNYSILSKYSHTSIRLPRPLRASVMASAWIRIWMASGLVVSIKIFSVFSGHFFVFSIVFHPIRKYKKLQGNMIKNGLESLLRI